MMQKYIFKGILAVYLPAPGMLCSEGNRENAGIPVILADRYVKQRLNL